MAIKILLGLCLLASILLARPAPVPTCSASQPLIKFPISPEEIRRDNLNHIFKGFNLQYSLAKTAPSFVYIQPQIQQVQHQ